MALITSLPSESKSKSKPKIKAKVSDDVSGKAKKHRTATPPSTKRRRVKSKPEPPEPHQKNLSSWDQIKNMLTCKQVEGSTVHDPSASASGNKVNPKSTSSHSSSSCGRICSFRDVVHGNTRVVHRADNSPESSSVGQETRLLKKPGNGSSSRSYSGNSVRPNGSTVTYNTSCRGMQFRKLSGCYECHTIVDPSRYPSPRTTICACSECGEVFPKIESLEHHQAVRHAVAELGPDDSSRNIVEIIFKSSWLKKDHPICNIERILKVHNTQRTIQRFEDCRDAVKIRANANSHKRDPRCAADGNELLRFHCTSLTCALGARGSSSLCGSVPGCGVCTAIRHGFQGSRATDVRTTASSGRAHDCLPGGASSARRAMLVCRVIAGRVKRLAENAEPDEEIGAGSYDSVAGYAGIYSNLEELYVFNPRAILPCFVVIYKTLES